jgi:hypothetical protein
MKQPTFKQNFNIGSIITCHVAPALIVDFCYLVFYALIIFVLPQPLVARCHPRPTGESSQFWRSGLDESDAYPRFRYHGRRYRPSSSCS